MPEEVFRSPSDTPMAAVSLHTVWEVDADASYDIAPEYARATARALHHLGGTGFIALRTTAGAGRIYLSTSKAIDLPPSSLVIVDWDHLRRYHTKGTRWSFWWFEFLVSGAVGFELNTRVAVPPGLDSEGALGAIARGIRHASLPRRRITCADFAALMFRWSALWEQKGRPHPYRDRIHRIIAEMPEHFEQSWTVASMARHVAMGERNFREAFKEVAGESPKRFYDRLRMAMADEWLRQGRYNISQVADRLGFSSPFHFSRTYRNHFGVAPSRAWGARS